MGPFESGAAFVCPECDALVPLVQGWLQVHRQGSAEYAYPPGLAAVRWQPAPSRGPCPRYGPAAASGIRVVTLGRGRTTTRSRGCASVKRAMP